MTGVQRTVLAALVVFVAAVAGVWVGHAMFKPAPPPGAELHALLHDGLELDAAQQAQLEVLEQRFGVRRRALELELRADNARLAEAIEAEHGDGPQVQAAVDRSHQVMGELQKATLAHVFAMRALLHPDQAAKFDQLIVRKLTDGGE